MQKIREAELFKKNGWFILDLMDPTPLFQARVALQDKLHQLMGEEVSLEKYHEFVEDDEQHTELQITLKDFFSQEGYGPKIIKAQENFFEQLLGPDLLVQANPYLRITRPFKPQDNIGFHRDTFYGGSPYELSVLIPFVNVPPECSLSVLTASHTLPESRFPTKQIVSADTAKGSEKHKLGFLYAPKLMDRAIEREMEAIELNLGQALVFSLSTVHGSVENRGNITRWSIDIRVLNALAPVDLSSRPDYYTLLNRSPVTECALQYFEAAQYDS